MSSYITPGEDANKQRIEVERSIPLIAQKIAQKIVDDLEPRFSDAFAKGTVTSFREFVFDQHINVIEHKWLEENGLIVRHSVGDILIASKPIIKRLLEEKYEILADVDLYNGGAPEFILDWYNCEIWESRKKRSFWRFWLR